MLMISHKWKAATIYRDLEAYAIAPLELSGYL